MQSLIVREQFNKVKQIQFHRERGFVQSRLPVQTHEQNPDPEKHMSDTAEQQSPETND